MKSLKQEKLNEIAEEIANCRICKRGKSGLPVPGEGSPTAKVVFIGEAPGKQEARTGRPFVGRAGKLLRELIREAGLLEEKVFITSPVKYFPKHLTPTPAEVAHGRKHLREQLDVIKPRIVVLLGRVAALALLEEKIEVAKAHGCIVEKDGNRYFVAYHPAAPLHNPKLRKVLKEDFKKLKQFL
jgi:DNA polymerase